MGKWQGRCTRVLLGESISDAAGARCGVVLAGRFLAAVVLWKRVHLTCVLGGGNTVPASSLPAGRARVCGVACKQDRLS